MNQTCGSAVKLSPSLSAEFKLSDGSNFCLVGAHPTGLFCGGAVSQNEPAEGALLNVLQPEGCDKNQGIGVAGGRRNLGMPSLKERE
jgi:hypothetical protein